tara:strand:+ start:301 stop:723 length:423 start_codon:yes stop_codon:yes gene_type:complete
MIKVVLDTNIIISAVLSSDGNPAKIFEMLLSEKIQNFTTTEIIEEITGVLNRPRISKRLNFGEKEFILNNFNQFSTLINPIIKLMEIKEDPDDNKFLECAISAHVHYIISGDYHLLNVKEFKGIPIVRPAEFVQLMEKMK